MTKKPRPFALCRRCRGGGTLVWGFIPTVWLLWLVDLWPSLSTSVCLGCNGWGGLENGKKHPRPMRDLEALLAAPCPVCKATSGQPCDAALHS